MKPFITEYNSVVYALDETLEIEISHVELQGEEFENEPNPTHINRALAAYLAVYRNRKQD